MKRYEKYKSTGVEWIGEIPKHWEVNRLKWIAKFEYGESLAIDDRKDGAIPAFGSNGITGFHDTAITKSPCIIIGRKGSFGKVNWSGGECYPIDTTYFIDETKTNSELRWLFYLLPNLGLDLFSRDTGVPGLNREDAYQNNVPVPPKEEQTAIANYLDEKITQIDKLITNKQKLIELLREERNAIINQAVTKGIDPNVKLKPSEIEWLGDIPEHWEVVKFNHYIKLRHGYQFMNYDFTSDGVKVVKITQLKSNGILDISDASYIDSSRLKEFKDILINEGDILMALTGGTIGKIIRVAEVKEPLLQNYRVGNFFPANSKIGKDFMFWVLSSEVILSQIFYEQRETGQPNIGKEDFSKMYIVLPPLKEQTTIVQFIKTGTQKLDTAIFKIEKEIELLQEYRTALISEVVTGKIKVV